MNYKILFYDGSEVDVQNVETIKFSHNDYDRLVTFFGMETDPEAMPIAVFFTNSIQGIVNEENTNGRKANS